MVVEDKLGNALEELTETATALRNHTVGDMLHDTLRADVYAAYYAVAHGAEVKDVEKDVAEHATNFRNVVNANKDLPLTPEVRAKLDELAVPLRDYIAEAETIVKTIGKNQEAAMALMPGFLQKFTVLEKAMDSAGDAIEAIALEAEQNASFIRRLSRSVGVVGIIIALLTAGIMLAIVRRGVLVPLSDIGSVMRRLAAREGVKIPHQDRNDELGDMARSISVFQSAMEQQALAEQSTVSERARAAEQRRLTMDGMIQQISQLAEAASQGDFTVRIPANREDRELAQVADRLNTLVDTVDKGLSETVEALGILSTGDLTVRVAGDYRGAFAALKDGANMLADRLAEAMASLTASAGAVRTAASEIGLGMEDLARRTSDQASTVSSTSSALSQFTGRIRQNATLAGDATRTVRDAEKRAHEGSAVLGSAREAMNRISSSSSRISDIVELIDGIAFQTNLLALNAAVEAARAGEVGRGFAVVASEVRTLAQRAAEASQEIKGLIGQAQTEIASGVSLVAETSVSLESIFSTISDVTRMMGMIASSANEQADEIVDLNAAVERLGDAEQQNASLVEETTAAIGATEHEAERLEKLAQEFKLVSHGRPRARRAA
jgi:methyl-accepting chemotaxis protein